LYLKALLRGVDPGPPPDWEFRQGIEEELKVHGSEALHKRLELVDPLSAARLHPADKRRIIRALEVFRQTGQPLSHRQFQFDEGLPAEKCKVFVLSPARSALHARIDARVNAMFAAGFVDEVRSLLEKYGSLSRTAMQAVGYREVIEHCQRVRDLPDTIQLVKARTHQFARRQDTWFRSLSECRPVPQDGVISPEQTAANIAAWGRILAN
jgi:tRNA dimethylallyltransferase